MVEIKVGFNKYACLCNSSWLAKLHLQMWMPFALCKSRQWKLCIGDCYLSSHLPLKHLQRFLTYGRRPCAPKLQAKNGLVYSMLGVIVQNVAFIFYHFVIMNWFLKMVF